MSRKKTKERTITGIVVPEDWDEHDNVIRVAIKTSDYQEYIVEHNKQSKQLLPLVDHKVRIKGRVRERLDGVFIVSVGSYELIEERREEQYIAEH